MTKNDDGRHASRGLAALAGLLADGTRASFCLALLDGRAWTATELTRHAEVAASTATEHLNLLVAGGLLAEERQGRHRALARARTCYDHLAGALGVAVTEAMTGRGLLNWDHGLTLTGDGLDWLAGLGLALPASRRPPVRSCLDWTERRPHLSGAVGALVCRPALDA